MNSSLLAPVVTAAPPDDEDDPTGGYDVKLDPELEELRRKRAEEEEAKKKARKAKQALPKMTRKKKAIPEAEAWKKVRLGLLFVLVGTCIWTFTHLAQGSYVVLGMVEFPEYAQMVATNLEMRGGEEDFPARGNFWDVDQLNVYLGMIAGRDMLGYAVTMITLSSLLYIVQWIFWVGGYAFCLSVPRRFGAYGQTITSMILAFFNFIFMFFFKVLPVCGAFAWIMIPYVTPEICMMEYNMERIVPINIMWSAAPFWENFLNLIFKFVFYLQPTFGCIFLWSIGKSIKEESIEQGGRGMTQMSLGTFFILFCFHMLSMCGATPVLVWVLRVFYTVWFCFLFLFMVQYAMLIMKARALLYVKIYPKDELE